MPVILVPCLVACLPVYFQPSLVCLLVSHGGLRHQLFGGRMSHQAAQCAIKEQGTVACGCCGYPEKISSKVSDQLAQPQQWAAKSWHDEKGHGGGLFQGGEQGVQVECNGMEWNSRMWRGVMWYDLAAWRGVASLNTCNSLRLSRSLQECEQGFRDAGEQVTHWHIGFRFFSLGKTERTKETVFKLKKKIKYPHFLLKMANGQS